MSLDRFHEAQSGAHSGYEAALAEMRGGRKTRHWIWYIFPQIDGLGRSATAQFYALRDLDETCDYLRDAQLRSRYEEITQAVAEKLERGVPVETLMGGSTDAQKLASSLTLFRTAASRLAGSESEPDLARLAECCGVILGRLESQGYPACQFTMERCGG